MTRFAAVSQKGIFVYVCYAFMVLESMRSRLCKEVSLINMLTGWKTNVTKINKQKNNCVDNHLLLPGFVCVYGTYSGYWDNDTTKISFWFFCQEPVISL